MKILSRLLLFSLAMLAGVLSFLAFARGAPATGLLLMCVYAIAIAAALWPVADRISRDRP